MKSGDRGIAAKPLRAYLLLTTQVPIFLKLPELANMKNLLLAALAAATIPFSAGAMAAEKPPIVLVHGAFENASVWGHVTAKLQADGYKVIAVDLPGRPGAPAAPDKVSLDIYRDTVVSALGQFHRPAVVVGHSFGGIVIADAAEKAPEKIKTLVFVAAYLPHDGDSLVSMANQDADAKIGPHLQINKDTGIASIEYSARADLFANGGPEELRKAIPDLILDEPLAPLATPVHLTAANFGSVNKVYVHTAMDQVISPSYQAKMVANTPVHNQFTLQTGHTPFLTDPDGLAKAIEAAAK
jgi:pimeloyl-ACP methyl ester carboxylesterase